MLEDNYLLIHIPYQVGARKFLQMSKELELDRTVVSLKMSRFECAPPVVATSNGLSNFQSSPSVEERSASSSATSTSNNCTPHSPGHGSHVDVVALGNLCAGVANSGDALKASEKRY